MSLLAALLPGSGQTYLHEVDRHAKKDLKAPMRDIRPVERMMENLLAGCRGTAPVYIGELRAQDIHIVQDYCLMSTVCQWVTMPRPGTSYPCRGGMV
jgi:hypothetical protein